MIIDEIAEYVDPSYGGFVQAPDGRWVAPGQLDFERIARGLPKCATENDLVSALRDAASSFTQAGEARNVLLRAANNPRGILKTEPGGVYCTDSPQRRQVYKAITGAFQGQAVAIGVSDVEKRAVDDLVEQLDPTRDLFWDNLWKAARPWVIGGGIAVGGLIALNAWGAVSNIRRATRRAAA